MKRIINIAFIAFFLLICICPSALIIFGVGQGTDPIGNEQKANLPVFADKNGLNNSFSTEFNNYFAQANPLRNSLINAENSLKINLLGSDSNGVIAGENGYLFSSETTDDYLGKCLEDRQLYSIAKTVQLVQQSVEAKNSNFAFAIVPNKNSLYSKYMPSRYIKSNENNLAKLEKYINKLNVNYVDIKTQFSDIADETDLYLKDDTHWNNLGAMYGYNAISNKLMNSEQSVTVLNEKTLTCLGNNSDNTNIPYKINNDFIGDLTKMAFPCSNRTCSQYYFDYSMPEYSYLQPRVVEDNKKVLETLMSDEEKIDGLIRTDNSSATGSVYVLRDSFGRALLPYFISNYSSAYITRFQPISLADNMFDDVVWEAVERNVIDIIKTAPLIYATESDVLTGDVCQKSDNSVYVDETDNSISIYGKLNQEYFETESNIYVQLDNEKNEYMYEAFPIFESDKLGKNNGEQQGFSVLLDKAKIENGDYNISFIVSGSTVNKSTGTICNISKG